MTARLVLEWALRIVLAATFLYAGVMKVRDPAQFLIDVESFRMLPYPGAVAMVWFLPWLEIFCAVALLLRVADRGAQILIFLMLVMFLGAISLAYSWGLDISCGCFGKSLEKSNYGELFVRDIVLILISGALLWISWRPESARAP